MPVDFDLVNRLRHLAYGSYDAVDEAKKSGLLEGGMIVLTFAWLESYYDETKWKYLVKNLGDWEYADEWRALYFIRHCFAHTGNGEILPSKKTVIEKLFTRLKNNEIDDGRGKPKKPYFHIDNNRIVLHGNCIDRCRMACIRFSEKFIPESKQV